jgi:hypothetical protein
MPTLDTASSLLKQPYAFSGGMLQQPEGPNHDKISMINQKLDSVVKVLQMLV